MSEAVRFYPETDFSSGPLDLFVGDRPFVWREGLAISSDAVFLCQALLEIWSQEVVRENIHACLAQVFCLLQTYCLTCFLDILLLFADVLSETVWDFVGDRLFVGTPGFFVGDRPNLVGRGLQFCWRRPFVCQALPEILPQDVARQSIHPCLTQFCVFLLSNISSGTLSGHVVGTDEALTSMFWGGRSPERIGGNRLHFAYVIC